MENSCLNQLCHWGLEKKKDDFLVLFPSAFNSWNSPVGKDFSSFILVLLWPYDAVWHDRHFMISLWLSMFREMSWCPRFLSGGQPMSFLFGSPPVFFSCTCWLDAEEPVDGFGDPADGEASWRKLSGALSECMEQMPPCDFRKKGAVRKNNIVTSHGDRVACYSVEPVLMHAAVLTI